MSSTATDLETTRIDAIHDSGWSRSFTFYQPRNLAFWAYLLLVVSGTATFVSALTRSYDAYPQAITVAVVLFALYGAVFGWFTQHIDRYARQPVKLMVVAFVWGGFAATWAMAAHANDAIRALYAKGLGQAWSFDWGAGLAAPFTEEIAKGAGLVLLIAMAPRLIRTAFDGFILGAFIGLGFQIVEDVAYAMTSAGSEFGANQVGAAMGTIVMRMVLGVTAHILYSAVFCAGLVYLLGRPAEPRRVGRGLALMVGAMVLHGLWDSMGAIAGGNLGLTYVLMAGIMVVALVLVVRVFMMTVTREREFLRDIVAPEVAGGVLTAEEFEAMCGDRKARRAFRKAAPDHRGRKRRAHVLEAAFDLADELASARGESTDRVMFARDEVARIRAGIPSPVL
jgi:protease PrsW